MVTVASRIARVPVIGYKCNGYRSRHLSTATHATSPTPTTLYLWGLAQPTAEQVREPGDCAMNVDQMPAQLSSPLRTCCPLRCRRLGTPPPRRRWYCPPRE
jgi:hypothetical protein